MRWIEAKNEWVEWRCCCEHVHCAVSFHDIVISISISILILIAVEQPIYNPTHHCSENFSLLGFSRIQTFSRFPIQESIFTAKMNGINHFDFISLKIKSNVRTSHLESNGNNFFFFPQNNNFLVERDVARTNNSAMTHTIGRKDWKKNTRKMIDTKHTLYTYLRIHQIVAVMILKFETQILIRCLHIYAEKKND